MIQIKKISADEAIDLRHHILRMNLPKKESIFEGDYDKTTLHLGAFHKNILVGVITFHKKETEAFKVNPVYRLTGLSVDETFRGKGIGSKLIEKGLSILSEKQSIFVWCFARDTAIDFYKKNGFLLKIQQVIIPNIGSHRIMFKFVENLEN